MDRQPRTPITNSHSHHDTNTKSSFSIKSDNDYPEALDLLPAVLELASTISTVSPSLLSLPFAVLKYTANDIASSPIQSTKDAVNGIARLRRHHETTIFERHKSHVDESRPGDDECKQLKKWCEKIVGQTSSVLRSTRRYALDQLITIAVEDPFIRTILSGCRLPQYKPQNGKPGRLVMMSCRARLCIEDSTLGIHILWSNLLSCCEHSHGKLSLYVQSYRDPLNKSLSDPDVSFLGARYLRHALQPCLVGNDYFCLAKIWHHYMDVAGTVPHAIEWPNFDECIKTIHSSNKVFTGFVSPTRLAKLAKSLIQEASRLPNVFDVIFGFPKIIYEVSGAQVEGLELTERIAYKHVRSHNFDVLPVFLSEFIQASDKYSNSWKLPAIMDADPKIRGVLKNTVLVSAKWNEYSPLGSNVFNTYSNQYPPQFGSLRLDRSDSTLTGAIIGPSGSESLGGRALALFLLARYAGIDRYCKRWLRHAFDSPFPSSLVNNVCTLVGPFKCANLFLFDNAPYLRRFRINGRLFITSDHLPEPPQMLIASSTNNILRDFSVDSMVINTNNVLWLSVVGQTSPFDSTGHYPILAGSNEQDTPLYIATVRDGFAYYFTYVEEGASTVRYIDEIGDTHGTDKFFVLALRHDPSDLAPPYPRNPSGAMDPTGPLHWLTFWPQKDPDYRALSDSAALDDSHLESVLNCYSRRDDGGADGECCAKLTS